MPAALGLRTNTLIPIYFTIRSEQTGVRKQYGYIGEKKPSIKKKRLVVGGKITKERALRSFVDLGPIDNCEGASSGTRSVATRMILVGLHLSVTLSTNSQKEVESRCARLRAKQPKDKKSSSPRLKVIKADCQKSSLHSNIR